MALTVTVSQEQPIRTAWLPSHAFTVDDYETMIRAGVLNEDSKVELLEGVVVDKMTKNQHHVVIVMFMQHMLAQLVPNHWFVMMEQPISTTDSMPEPNLSLVKGQFRDYLNRRITPDRIGLVIEVADSSLTVGQTVKLAVYARAGIPVYWVVNLNESVVEVYQAPVTDPTPRYTTKIVYTAADAVPFTLDGVEIARVPVAEIMP